MNSILPGWFTRLIKRQEGRPFHFYNFLLLCSFVGIVRTLSEALIFGHPIRNSFIVSAIPFYLSYGLMLAAGLRLVTGADYKRVLNAVGLGLFLGIFPPFLDLALTPVDKLGSFWYSYYFYWNFESLPWALYSPQLLIPFGESFILWTTVFFCLVYSLHHKKIALAALAGGAAAYLTALYQGAFMAMVIVRLNIGPILAPEQMNSYTRSHMQVLSNNFMFWHTMTAIACWMLLRPVLFGHFFKRMLHILPFVLITILGAVLTRGFDGAALRTVLLIFVACLATICQNDYFDYREDRHAGRRSKVNRHDLYAFNSLLFFLFLSLFFAGENGALPLLIFFAASVVYNYPFYRGKKYFPLSLKVEGVWGGSAFLAGSLSQGHENFNSSILLLTFLFFGGWSLVTAIKDLKDIRADKKARITSAYLWFQRRGFRLSSVHRWFVAIIFACFLIPVIWAAATSQLTAALVLGLLCLLPLAWLLYRGSIRALWFEKVLTVYNLFLLCCIVLSLTGKLSV